MAMKDDDEAGELKREFDRVARNRGTWEAHWQEIAERMLPSWSGSFVGGNPNTPGSKRTHQIFDSTAPVALKRFAAVMDSLLTPSNQTWHHLRPSEPELAGDRDVKLWFEEVNRRLFRYRYAPKANFASQNLQDYMSLGAFGTGCMFIDKLAGEPGLRYRAIHLGETFFLENHQGLIDTAYRRFTQTARQAVQRWGDDLPEKITKAAKDRPETEFTFLHCVKPNEDRDPERMDAKGMAFQSRYLAYDDTKIVARGGYNTFPYAIPRYEQAPGEVYGRSPAMDVLPAVKTLNEEKKTVLKQGHRTVDPVLLAHDDGIVDTFSLKPGSINAGGMSAEGRPLVGVLPVGNIAIGKELMDDERAIINDAFLVSLFQILVENPQMTATEVLERTREKGILLAPTVGRQESEKLGPLIEREVDVLSRQGLLPPMPPILLEAGGGYRVEYDNPMARTRRAEEASGVMRAVQSTLEIVNVTGDPGPLDYFDFDKIVPQIAAIGGTPTSWMRTVEDVAAIRQGRQQQQMAKQMAEAAPGAAALLNAGTKANAVGAK